MWSPPGMADRARAAGSQSRAAAGTEICPDQALVVRVRVHRVWRGEVRVSARRAQAVRAGVLACRVPWAKARVSARRALWAKARVSVRRALWVKAGVSGRQAQAVEGRVLARMAQAVRSRVLACLAQAVVRVWGYLARAVKAKAAVCRALPVKRLAPVCQDPAAGAAVRPCRVVKVRVAVCQGQGLVVLEVFSLVLAVKARQKGRRTPVCPLPIEGLQVRDVSRVPRARKSTAAQWQRPALPGGP